MESNKLRWIETNSQCPLWGSSQLELETESLICQSCEQRYPVGHVIDFLTPETKAAFEIIETENVSDHPFDGNALSILDRCFETGGMALDCGSGSKATSMPHLIQMEIVEYPSVDILAVNQRLPFRECVFDAVFSLDVLEHVDDPFASAQEIYRVLKPGGIVYIDLPFLQAEHGYPNHFFNATRQGLRRLFSSMEVLDHRVPGSGHPIWTLHQICDVWRAGLPEEERSRFLATTVGEILEKNPISWLPDPLCTTLDPQMAWTVASTTQALLRKADGTGPESCLADLRASQVPGFS